MNTGGQPGAAATPSSGRVPTVSMHQVALEASDLWKLYQAIAEGEDHGTLLNRAREANAEFIRNRMQDQVAG